MINIRYHIVSITAIFLALGIGTLLGSTFLDRATVDQLDRNIRNAESRIADTEQKNDQLEEKDRRALARDEALIDASETLLAGQLTDRPVLLVVAPGVEQATVDRLREILGHADADLRGSLALREDLTLSGGIGADMAESLDIDEDDSATVRAEVIDQLVDALVAAGAPADLDEQTPPEGDPADPTTTTTAPGGEVTTTLPGETTTTGPTTTTTTTTTVPEGDPGDDPTDDPTDDPDDPDDPDAEDPDALDGEQPEVLTALIEADLIRLDPGPAYEPTDPVLERTGYRYVYVTQPDLDAAADTLLLDLLPETETDPPLPAVVVSTTPEPPAEGAEELPPTAVGRVRSDPARSGLYDTVDDIDTYLGLSSTVTILRADEGAAAGHYGQGEGATALAPAGR
ncbi:MAG TPA: copper transporter [Iamia sp.]|nr:copper transporter [Iamia sp.]